MDLCQQSDVQTSHILSAQQPHVATNHNFDYMDLCQQSDVQTSHILSAQQPHVATGYSAGKYRSKRFIWET